VFQSFTGLPEHQVTNTLYFAPVGPLNDTTAGDIVTVLNAFYDGIQGMYSQVLTGSVEVKLYDMADPEPRSPWNPGWGFSMSIPAGTTGMPEEVAVALSFHAAPPFTARRRGRIYIGPIGSGSITFGSSGDWCRVNSVTPANLCSDADDLRIAAAAAGIPWVVYSRADGVARNVVGGWVDNSLDTIRRRGHDETARATFGT